LCKGDEGDTIDFAFAKLNTWKFFGQLFCSSSLHEIGSAVLGFRYTTSPALQAKNIRKKMVILKIMPEAMQKLLHWLRVAKLLGFPSHPL
jgi:hypothetical protein